MDRHDLDCPKCQQNMIKSHGDHVKFRMKLLKWDKTGMSAVCKSCGHDVPVNLELMKSIQSSFTFEIPATGQEIKKT